MMNEHDERDDDLDARLEHRQREQLSALVDGELAPDQARFLLRRLEHDEALAGRWQRWHLVGDVLRGEAVGALPGASGGFAASVAAAVARDPAVRASRPRWRHGLGAAMAASVAAVALFLAWPAAIDGDPPSPMVAVDAPESAAPTTAAGPEAAPDPVRQVAVPQFAEALVPLPAASVRPDPGDAGIARRAATPAPAPTAPLPPSPGARDTLPAATVLAADTPPFAAPPGPQARPWPRASLPQLPGGERGGLTVGLDDDGPAPSFYPFEPRLPARDPSPGNADAAGEPGSTP